MCSLNTRRRARRNAAARRNRGSIRSRQLGGDGLDERAERALGGHVAGVEGHGDARAAAAHLDDAAAADELFSILMGEDVEARRSFITRNAKDVRFLDV
jgi:hypothetical protein